MDEDQRRKLCRKAFGLSCAASAVVALVMLAAGGMTQARWLGFAAGLAVCAGALALFGRAWGSAPNGAAVAVWYLLRMALVFGAVIAVVFVPWLDAVGVLVPQLFGLPALAILMVLGKRN